MNAILPFPTTTHPPGRPEIIIDSFAGGGGASTGIYMALGRHPEVAINHDELAVAMHAANHPSTDHYCKSVYQVDPRDAAKGRPVGLLWASPDCKHFSKAKGGKPVSKNIRDLAWTVTHYAELVRPRVIILENVEEFKTWGPLSDDGRPHAGRKGETFAAWVKSLRRLGYRVDWRELRACDYGAPTIRKRLFVIARRDGHPIVWPDPTHGAPNSAAVLAGHRQPWQTAADIIDWSIPCPSIFSRSKPLAEATLRRIAKGIMRHVVQAQEPFIVADHAHSLVQVGYGERPGQAPRALDIGKPLGTLVATGKHALVSAHVSRQFGRSFGASIAAPLGTVTAGGGKAALVSAFLAKHYTGVIGQDLGTPLGTVTTVDHHSVVAAHLSHFSGRGSGEGDPRKPIKTATAGGNHAGLVAALLTKYYSTGGQDQVISDPLHTVTTTDRYGLVTVHLCGEPYVITDIGLRMLQPRELFRAQGFPDDYQIDLTHNGRALSKSDQVRMCGNSVCPPIAAALVAANVPELATKQEAAE
jgi:DNA (cytosine-5)-methyltransferase 1